MPKTKDDLQLSRARHLNIIKILKDQPAASIRELAEQLEISQSTIRRDLDELESQGLARRVFGGAILERQVGAEPPFEFREALNASAKDKVAKAAADLVVDGDTVFIDGGTSTQFLVKYLANKKDLTVITCGLNVAYELNKYDNISSFIIGGELHKDSHSISGALALAVLEVYKIRCDKSIIAASAVSAEHGVTNRILDRIPLKRKAMEISRESILLADGSKIGGTAMGQIASLDEFSALVTDESVPPDELNAIRQMGIRVIVA